MNVLFICSLHRLRSPTAAQVFGAYPGIQAESAGLDPTADRPATTQLVEWADTIFVMEWRHQEKLLALFSGHLEGKKVICLNIPDKFDYMQPSLVRQLKRKVGKHMLLTSSSGRHGR